MGYENVAFEEVTEGINDIIRNMLVEKKAYVTSNGETIAALVAMRGQTYKGGGVVLTAVGTDGNIICSRILELNDSPQIGQLALEEDFYSQFTGKAATDSLLSANGDYDAMTGATITADCIADMVRVGAVEAVNMLSAKGLGLDSIDHSGYQLNENYLEE